MVRCERNRVNIEWKIPASFLGALHEISTCSVVLYKHASGLPTYTVT